MLSDRWKFPPHALRWRGSLSLTFVAAVSPSRRLRKSTGEGTMDHQNLLVTAASIIAGFGSAVIAFRLERELDIEEKNEEGRGIEKSATIPVSDWLVVTASIGALCFVVAPLVATPTPSDAVIRFVSAICSAMAIMLAGYIPSILAHYRFIYGLTEEPNQSNVMERRVRPRNRCRCGYGIRCQLWRLKSGCPDRVMSCR